MGIQRIGIVDFDVHHGNGTQNIFEEDDSVFFYSIHDIHRLPIPVPAENSKRVRVLVVGFTLNSPVLPGQGEKKYKELLQRDLFPAFEAFQPDDPRIRRLDAHIDDDMSDIKLSTEGFSWIMKTLLEWRTNIRKVELFHSRRGYSLQRLPN